MNTPYTAYDVRVCSPPRVRIRVFAHVCIFVRAAMRLFACMVDRSMFFDRLTFIFLKIALSSIGVRRY